MHRNGQRLDRQNNGRPQHSGNAKHHRQPREPIDYWLDAKGLYRKRVPRDASSLFRVVAEQKFGNQVYHEVVRSACIRYMRRNEETFKPKAKGDFETYLDGMKSTKTRGTEVEMLALSMLYNKDFLIYGNEYDGPVKNTKQGFPEMFHLCDCGGGHFDAVCEKETLTKAGIAQAITYEILYKDVFGMGESVNAYVDLMLRIPPTDRNAGNKQQWRSTASSVPKVDPVVSENYRKFGPPFPYKIAKSMQAHIFRNVGFDVSMEDQKETRRMNKGSLYGPHLVPGSLCTVEYKENPEAPDDEVEYLDGVIQEITPNEGPMIVFVYKMAEKIEVPYGSVRHRLPEPELPEARVVTRGDKHGNRDYGRNRPPFHDQRSNSQQSFKPAGYQRFAGTPSVRPQPFGQGPQPRPARFPKAFAPANTRSPFNNRMECPPQYVYQGHDPNSHQLPLWTDQYGQNMVPQSAHGTVPQPVYGQLPHQPYASAGQLAPPIFLVGLQSALGDVGRQKLGPFSTTLKGSPQQMQWNPEQPSFTWVTVPQAQPAAVQMISPSGVPWPAAVSLPIQSSVGGPSNNQLEMMHPFSNNGVCFADGNTVHNTAVVQTSPGTNAIPLIPVPFCNQAPGGPFAPMVHHDGAGGIVVYHFPMSADPRARDIPIETDPASVQYFYNRGIAAHLRDSVDAPGTYFVPQYAVPAQVCQPLRPPHDGDEPMNAVREGGSIPPMGKAQQESDYGQRQWGGPVQ